MTKSDFTEVQLHEPMSVLNFRTEHGLGILTGMQVMPKQLHQQKVSAQNEYQLLHSCAYRVLPRLHLPPPPAFYTPQHLRDHKAACS